MKFLFPLFCASSCFAAQLVNPTVSSSGGGGGPTNGLTMVQTIAAIGTNTSGSVYNVTQSTNNGIFTGMLGTNSTTSRAEAAVIASNQVVTGTAASSSSLVTNVSPIPYGANVITIDPVNGNDTLAAADPYHKLWKTTWDCTSTNPVTTIGAITHAQPGDWITYARSAKVYYVPDIPLNLMGGSSNGLNLWIPPGVIVAQTNFAAYPNAQVASGQNQGSFIFPGNKSQVIIDGTVYCTNSIPNTGPYTEVFGFQLAALSVQPNASAVGLTNYAPNEVWLSGDGLSFGYSDGIQYTMGSNSPASTILHVNGPRFVSWYDAASLQGSPYSNNLVVYFGPKCDFETTNAAAFTGNPSRGIDMVNCTLTIDRGYYLATGLTGGLNDDGAGDNAAISMQSCTATLNFPRLVAVGTTNVVPLFLNSATFNTTSGSISGNVWGSLGCFVTGSWYEQGGYQGYSNSTFVTTGLIVQTPTNMVNTNEVVVFNSGNFGANGVNGAYLADGDSLGTLTNARVSTQYLTNTGTGTGPFQILSANVVKGYSATLIGNYVPTNSVTGTPITVYTNFIGSTRSVIYSAN